MKKVTVITGKKGSGKTILAMKMAGTKKSIWANHLSDELLKVYLTDNTEAIILDEIKDFSATIQTLESLMKRDYALIAKPKENLSITRSLPEIILVTQHKKESLPAFILDNSNLISL